MTSAICTECKQEKPISAFTRDTNSGGGYRGECRNCRANRRRIRYALNRGFRFAHVGRVERVSWLSR